MLIGLLVNVLSAAKTRGDEGNYIADYRHTDDGQQDI